METTKVFLFLADGFEEIEAIAPIDILRRAGIDLVTVSVKSEKAVTGAHGVTILADKLFSEVDFAGNELLFLPGGLPGTTNLEKHEGLKKLIEKQAEAGGKLAAICAAPSIFGKMNLLKGKEAICYPGFENYLYDAKVSEKKVVQAGNIFTAKAAGVAVKFALELVKDLKGADVAQNLANALFVE